MRIFVFLLASLPFVAAPQRLSAQAVYYRSIPVGERAIGLAGAYTSIADDPSAAYYNPAGITKGGRFQLLGSLSSLVFTKSKINRGFEFEDEAQNFSSDTSTTLPRFVGTVVGFGRVKYGDHQFSVAYSSVEPQRNTQSFTDAVVTEESSVDIRLRNSFRARWYGASFAGRLSESMSLGTTAYVAVQRYGYDEDIGLRDGGTLDDGQWVNADFTTTSTEISAKSYHLVLRLGYLYQINPSWSWGVNFQAPGIPLRQRGGVFRRATVALDDLQIFGGPIDESGLDANMPIPFELRTGASYRINENTLVSADFSVNGPVGDGQLIGLPEEVSLRPGLYYSNSIERRWAPNAAVGAEHKFGKAVLAGGLFTNVSAAPDVSEVLAAYAPPQVNMYGASVYVGLDTKGYKLSFGATGEYGRGDALAVTIDRFGNPIQYRRTTASRGGLILFVAGAVSLASKAAKDIKEWHNEKQVEREAARHQAALDRVQDERGLASDYPAAPLSESPADSSSARSGLPSERSP